MSSEFDTVSAKPPKGSFLKKINTKIVLVAVVVIAVIATAAGGYFYLQYKNSQKLLQDPASASTEEIKTLLQKVGKLMVLPSGEDPTVATVSDKTKLSGQAFFAKAENGDKVIIYTSTGKAILYRPSADKIVDVATISVSKEDVAGASTQQSAGSSAITTTPSPSIPLTVAILNGTKVPGLAGKAGIALAVKVPGQTVKVKGNAKNDYEKTLVVDVNGTNKAKADDIAKAFGGSVVSLPAGEDKPATDILILLGDNSASL